MESLTNLHPVDEIAGIREQIKELETRESELRFILMRPDADLKGDEYIASIRESVRESIDKAALIAELGREAVEPFLKKSKIRALYVAKVTS